MPTEPPPPPQVSCAGLVKEYTTASGTVRALKGIDASFPAGKVTAVVGPSGSGKSSLLRILACVDRPTAGTVRVGGVEVSALRARGRRRVRRDLVGYVFQQPADNLLPYLSARGHLELAAGLRGRERPGEAERLLDRLGLAGRAEHLPGQLSGGEQQRLAFAAAVAGGPALVVADEPTAELDRESGERLMESVLALRDAGCSLLVASHDPVVTRAADRVLRLHDGEVARW
ncbi:MAG TPA: ABC transporter ATP-binding protein [Actinomycetes bacterium]|nr:ABC transporter ATP-binding protein [Actinomycetes bacterium]